MEKKAIESTTNDLYLTPDLIWNILVHVPTKSLMRLKFVSKLWYSIIRNIDFAKKHSLYGGCFRGIVITDFASDYRNFYEPSVFKNRVYYATLNANNFNKYTKLKYYKHCIWDLSDFERVTSIVKGLIGFYTYDCFTLCNISTQERVNLSSNPSYEFSTYSYHLGFDPVKDVYKVLKLVPDQQIATSFSTQIFTVGRDSDLAWRNIGEAPVDCGTHSLCIDGTLYWTLCESSDSLIAFHLNSESFENIPVPERSMCCAHLANIGGSPGIIFFEGFDIDIWMMKNDARGGSARWKMQAYRLPVQNLVWAGTLPTGEMLLTQSVLTKNTMLVFKYDHINNEMRYIELDGPSESRRHGSANFASLQMCYHEENIIPLAPLLKQRQPEATSPTKFICSRISAFGKRRLNPFS